MPFPMEVRILSRETVKPSSPTPHHLRTFKLALLDQLVPSCYAQVLLFYLINDLYGQSVRQISNILSGLKDSLAKTLTHFYPLAGAIGDGELHIDCNDQGVPYFEATVGGNLSDFLHEPELELVNQFFACDPQNTPPMAKLHLAMIQVNAFDLGGIAIGVSLNHKIADGSTLAAFIKAWTTISRGCFEEHPSFDASLLFPQNASLPLGYSIAIGKCLIRTGNCVTKRVVFDASAIAALKAKAIASLGCTRVKVVSAFIWKCAMAAAKQKHGARRPSVLTHAVNLRKKLTPSLPESSIGNLFWMATTEGEVDDDDDADLDLALLVDKTSNAMSKISRDFADKLRGESGFAVACERLEELKAVFEEDGVDFYGFSSRCNFGLYEADFGWGKPIWVSSYSWKGLVVYKNMTFLMDTRCGTGIEAWITLDEEVLAILESDPEFRSFASINPSPLKFG